MSYSLLRLACLPVVLEIFLVCTASSNALPGGPIILGYQNWGRCNLTETLASVENGVNVVIWFATNLEKNATTGAPIIRGGPNATCVAEVRRAIEQRGLATAHLISIGGWDAPHPDTSFSGSQWFSFWKAWNQALPRPFDGFDWDLEGNDNGASPYNTFTPEVLNLVVDMSMAAKKDGLIVTMVPAQSYLDSTTSGFNPSLLNAYADWHPDFHYHGRNCYAYLLAASPQDTFDLVSVQLYESWSRADQAILQQHLSPALYLQQESARLLHGWTVDFGDYKGLRVTGKHSVRVEASQLVIAFSFGSADRKGKSVFFWPESAGAAYRNSSPSQRPRGYGFWEIEMEGQRANGTNSTLVFASSLNSFLHIRQGPTAANADAALQVIV